MTSTYPPNPNFFDNGLNYNSNFFSQPSSSLSQATADTLYLKYPISQTGTETFSGAIVANNGITSNSLIVSNGTNTITISPTSNPATTITTTSDNSNTTCFIPFTKTTAGNNTALYLDDTLSQLSYNPSTSTLSCTNFNGSVSGITTTSDNSATTCYIPFIKTTASANSVLYVDDTTGVLSYVPSSGTLSIPIVSSARMDGSTATTNCSIFNNLTTGSVNFAAAQTTGSVNISNVSQTSGSIILGSTTCTTGLCNIRPPLVLSRQLQTTNSASYPPNAANHLGYQVTTLGAFFSAVNLPASTNVNLYSVSFTSANYGTYLFISNAIITPTDTTLERQVEISISTITTAIEAPHYAMQFVPKSGGSPPQLTLSRVIQIYSDTTVYLVGYCQGSTANVQITINNGLFQYTRIA